MTASWVSSHTEAGRYNSVVTRGPPFAGFDPKGPCWDADFDGSTDSLAFQGRHRGRRVATPRVLSAEGMAPFTAGTAQALQAGTGDKMLGGSSGLIRPAQPRYGNTSSAATCQKAPSSAAGEAMAVQEHFAGEVRALEEALDAVTNSVSPAWLRGPGASIEQELSRRKHVAKITQLRERLIRAQARLDAASALDVCAEALDTDIQDRMVIMNAAERVSADTCQQAPSSPVPTDWICSKLLGPHAAGDRGASTPARAALRCPDGEPPCQGAAWPRGPNSQQHRARPQSALPPGRARQCSSARGTGTLLQAARESVSRGCPGKVGQLAARGVDLACRCVRPASARAPQRGRAGERRSVEAVFARLASAQTASSRAHSAAVW
mmetsp:Transcript_56717/g.165982  ORF Transcript_56717/g.165982 Transcript_56717/m.165982 type:complete len:379 (+) Transcript_56717:99-1235(+)